MSTALTTSVFKLANILLHGVFTLSQRSWFDFVKDCWTSETVLSSMIQFRRKSFHVRCIGVSGHAVVTSERCLIPLLITHRPLSATSHTIDYFRHPALIGIPSMAQLKLPYISIRNVENMHYLSLLGTSRRTSLPVTIIEEAIPLSNRISLLLYSFMPKIGEIWS